MCEIFDEDFINLKKESEDFFAPVILANEKGTWSYDTMTRRYKDEILKLIYDENDLNEKRFVENKTKEKLDKLKEELENVHTCFLTYIEKDNGDDLHIWKCILKPFVFSNVIWINAPWMILEFYFYRRVLSAFDYFNTNYDPFAIQKNEGLKSSLLYIHMISNKTFNETININNEKKCIHKNEAINLKNEKKKCIYNAIMNSLWANQMDLSLWPKKTHKNQTTYEECTENKNKNTNKKEEEEEEEEEQNLLIKEGGDLEKYFENIVEEKNKNFLLANDFEILWNDLLVLTNNGEKTLNQVDIIIDNAGNELLNDMHLADIFLKKKLTKKIIFRLKKQPTFVSDATKCDFFNTLHFLLKQTQFENILVMGNRWMSYIQNKEWELADDNYWNLPLPFSKMSKNIYFDFKKNSDLIFVKGDCNYRRLIEDRRWQFSKLFSEVISYFPTRVVALRTLKADLGCGMNEAETRRAESRDSKWMYNGKWGVVQYFNPHNIS